MILRSLKKQIKLFGVLFIILCILGFAGFSWMSNYWRTQENNKHAEKIVTKCKTVNTWMSCYITALHVLNRTYSFENTLQVLKNIQLSDSRTNYCHFIAHDLMAVELEKNSKNWERLFTVMDDPYGCNGGFIHGVIEGEKKYSKLSLNEQTITRICNQIYKSTGGGYYYPCAHAAGHVLLVETRVELNQATAICKKLPDFMQLPCIEGVFMEYVNRPNLISHGLAKQSLGMDSQTISDFQNLCNSLDMQTSIGCWQSMGDVYVKVNGSDLSKIKEDCNKSNTKQAAMACYFKSFDFAFYTGDFNNQQLSTICNDFTNARSELFKCYNAAILALVYKEQVNYLAAEKMCRDAPEDFRDECNMIRNRYFWRTSGIDSQKMRQIKFRG